MKEEREKERKGEREGKKKNMQKLRKNTKTKNKSQLGIHLSLIEIDSSTNISRLRERKEWRSIPGVRHVTTN